MKVNSKVTKDSSKMWDHFIRFKLLLVVLYIIAFFSLVWGYRVFVSPIFEYAGFVWNVVPVKVIESVIIVLVIVLFLPVKFSKPSDVLVHIQFLFPVLPMLVLYGVQNRPRTYLWMSVLAFLLLMLIAQHVRLKAVRLRAVMSPVLYQRMLLFVGWSVIVVIILLGGWRYFNLDLRRVYEFRFIAAENLPRVFGYISPLTSKVIFPFALLLAVVEREKLMAIFSVAGSVMMFGLTSHKGPLFYPLVVLALYYIVCSRYSIRLMLWGYSLLVIVSVVFYYLLGNIYFGSLILRRAFFVPALLNYLYYDFFSTHVFACWARSKVTFRLVEPRYVLDIPHLIGYFYYNRPECGANTGWLGSGYANAGYLGMFLCGVLIGIFLALLNSYGHVIDKRVVVAIVTAPLLAVFMSSDIFTAFLTHGAIVAVLLFVAFPKMSISHQRVGD